MEPKKYGFAMAFAGLLAACTTAGPRESTGGDVVQAVPRYQYEPAVAADVAAMIKGIEAAQGRARLARLLQRGTP